MDSPSTTKKPVDSPQSSTEVASLSKNKLKNKEALERRLKTRRSVKELVNLGILMNPLISNHDRVRKLQRAKTSDYLKNKIQQRPDRETLITQRILKSDKAGLCRDFERNQLKDALDCKLSERPGSLELVERGVLQVDPTVDTLVKRGSLVYPRVTNALVNGVLPSVLEDTSAAVANACTSGTMRPPTPPPLPPPSKGEKGSTISTSGKFTMETVKRDGFYIHQYRPIEQNREDRQKARIVQQEKLLNLQACVSDQTSPSSDCDPATLVQRLSINKLRHECRARNLSVLGTKTMLTQSLAPFHAEIVRKYYGQQEQTASGVLASTADSGGGLGNCAAGSEAQQSVSTLIQVHQQHIKASMQPVAPFFVPRGAQQIQLIPVSMASFSHPSFSLAQNGVAPSVPGPRFLLPAGTLNLPVAAAPPTLEPGQATLRHSISAPQFVGQQGVLAPPTADEAGHHKPGESGRPEPNLRQIEDIWMRIRSIRHRLDEHEGQNTPESVLEHINREFHTLTSMCRLMIVDRLDFLRETSGASSEGESGIVVKWEKNLLESYLARLQACAPDEQNSSPPHTLRRGEARPASCLLSPMSPLGSRQPMAHASPTLFSSSSADIPGMLVYSPQRAYHSAAPTPPLQARRMSQPQVHGLAYFSTSNSFPTMPVMSFAEQSHTMPSGHEQPADSLGLQPHSNDSTHNENLHDHNSHNGFFLPGDLDQYMSDCKDGQRSQSLVDDVDIDELLSGVSPPRSHEAGYSDGELNIMVNSPFRSDNDVYPSGAVTITNNNNNNNNNVNLVNNHNLFPHQVQTCPGNREFTSPSQYTAHVLHCAPNYHVPLSSSHTNIQFSREQRVFDSSRASSTFFTPPSRQSVGNESVDSAVANSATVTAMQMDCQDLFFNDSSQSGEVFKALGQQREPCSVEPDFMDTACEYLLSTTP